MKCENDIGNRDCSWEATHFLEIRDGDNFLTIAICEKCTREFRGLKLHRITAVDLKTQK